MTKHPFKSIHFVTRGRTNRGGHVVLTNIMRALIKRGYDVSLMSSREAGKALYPNCEELWQGLPIGVQDIALGNSEEERFLIEQEALQKHLVESVSKYDIVILDSWLVALAAIKAGISRHKHVFQLVQSDANFQMENLSKCWKAELFSLIPHFPMQRITVSKSMQAVYEQRYGEIMDFMPLFIDDAYHSSSFEVQNNTTLRIMSSAATFDPVEKGLDLLLSTLTQVKEFPYMLTLVSGKSIDRDLSQYPFQITQCLAATPQEMASIMLSHDIYVCPSTKESFGLAQAEAIALGMPVLAMNAGGNQDFIDGSNALLANTPEELLHGLRRMSDMSLRTSLHTHAKPSMAGYKLSDTVEAFLSILSKRSVRELD